MTDNQAKGVQLFREGSKGIWGLTGDSQSTLRQTIMQLLTGEKMPKAKCGINALTVKVREFDPTISRY